MPMTHDYAAQEPARADVDALPGVTLLEFGAPWCGHCRAAQPMLPRALEEYPGVRHLKIEDGAGRRLGRSFQVKLWPTLILLKDGQELARRVRPGAVAELLEALALAD
ncbi:thioredoxin family protein [Pseudomonas oryzihabitans]|uniref:thioredoxin family protein n=1 Tax=Pseudomonas oryzihabitans TaxID=47885 RepID=UPI00119D9392|nr:thioredoxin family protein [Pseudomonas psychrotolerans]